MLLPGSQEAHWVPAMYTKQLYYISARLKHVDSLMMGLFGLCSESEPWWATTWKPPEMRIRHIHSLAAQGLGKQKDVLGDAPSLYIMSQNHMLPSQTRKGGSSPSSAHIKDPPASLWHSLKPYAYSLVSNSTRFCFNGFLGLRDRRNFISSSIKIWYQSQ